MAAGSVRPAVSTLKLVPAFACIYVLWGSTFLAIRFGLESFPPLLLMGFRSFIAGGLLYAFARAAGAPRPSPAMWRPAFVAGALLFLVCHGGLAYGEQTVASGLAAVLSATIPLWMVLLDWLAAGRERPTAMTGTGIVIGFAGVAMLVRPLDAAGASAVDPVGSVVILIGAFAWASGALYARQAVRPASLPLATGMQLLAGGTLLFLVGGLFGEWAVFEPSAVTARSALSLGYLIVFGSIVAFTAFLWLMDVSTPARVSTYAYINPIVALVLGYGFAGEPIARGTIVSAGVILAGVALVIGGRRR